MKSVFTFATLYFFSLATSTFAQATSFSSALAEIRLTADSICQTVTTDGSAKSFSIEGDADAELSKLLGKLIDLGIEGAADFKDENYSGVLRSELTENIRNGNDCKLEVFKTLASTMLGADTSQAVEDEKIETFSASRTAQILGVETKDIYINSKIAAAPLTANLDDSGRYLSSSFYVKNISNVDLYLSIIIVRGVPYAHGNNGQQFKIQSISGVGSLKCSAGPTCNSTKNAWTRFGKNEAFTIYVQGGANPANTRAETVTVALDLFTLESLANDSTQERETISFPRVIVQEN